MLFAVANFAGVVMGAFGIISLPVMILNAVAAVVCFIAAGWES